MARSVVRQGALAPKSYSILAQAGDSGVDMTTVTAATIEVQLPDGSRPSWPALLSNASVASVLVTHAFAAGDLPIRGFYAVLARLTVPFGSNVLETDPERLAVLGEFEVEDLFFDP